MHGTSLASAKTVLAQAEPVLSDAGADAGTIGGQLLDAVSIFDGSGPLRRALTDPAREGKDKAALVKQLFAGADKRTVAILSDLVSQRWSSEEVLADAAELIGVEALLIAAENAEVLPLVADQLFQVDREIHRDRELRNALGDHDLKAEQRRAIVDALFAERIHPLALQLTQRAVEHPRGRSLTASLVMVGDLAAQRRNRRVAAITSATPLSQAQEERLGELLKQIYGFDMQLNITVEQDVVGGLRVQVGDEVLDATVLTRLSEARRSFAAKN